MQRLLIVKQQWHSESAPQRAPFAPPPEPQARRLPNEPQALSDEHRPLAEEEEEDDEDEEDALLIWSANSFPPTMPTAAPRT